MRYLLIYGAIVLLAVAVGLCTGCASDSTLRTSMFTFQQKSSAPAPCEPADTNTGSLLSETAP